MDLKRITFLSDRLFEEINYPDEISVTRTIYLINKSKVLSDLLSNKKRYPDSEQLLQRLLDTWSFLWKLREKQLKQ
jgi:hypothetical protein